MSRTYRAVPNWADDPNQINALRRGHISIDKYNYRSLDPIWGRKRKRSRKRMISRTRRRNDD